MGLGIGPIWTKIGPECPQTSHFVVSEGLLKSVLGAHLQGFALLGVVR